jgi:hypothetical protein
MARLEENVDLLFILVGKIENKAPIIKKKKILRVDCFEL